MAFPGTLLAAVCFVSVLTLPSRPLHATPATASAEPALSPMGAACGASLESRWRWGYEALPVRVGGGSAGGHAVVVAGMHASLLFGRERREEHAMCFDQRGDLFGLFVDGAFMTGDAHQSASAGAGLELLELGDLIVGTLHAGATWEARKREGQAASVPGLMLAGTIGLGGYGSRRRALAGDIVTWSLRLEARRTIEDSPVSTLTAAVQLDWIGSLWAF